MVILPFLMSMLLGRTIDLKTYHIAGDVFDPDDYVETRLNVLNSTYLILEENDFPYSYIGLPADLVLRIKTNHLSSASGSLGLDGLLREHSWKAKSVVVAVTTLKRTVYRELQKDAVTVSGWTERIDRAQSHYVSTIFYGGWSVMLFRYVCNADEDQHLVRNILKEHLGPAGDINEDTVAKWNEAHRHIKKSRELSGKLKVETSRYSSLPMCQDISSPDKLLQAIQKFGQNVGDLGQPMYVELKPLHDLDTRYPLVKENAEIESTLERLYQLLDDLKQAQGNMRHWISTTLAEFSDEDEKTISDVFAYVSECIQVYNSIAAEASVYRSMDIHDLRSAIHMYRKGLNKKASSYQALFRRLKEDLDPQCTDNFGYRIRGILLVAEDEKLQMGQMRNGLKECKAECLQEPKCRAIGYADKYPITEYKNGVYQQVVKYKQCWLYFRSSSTSRVLPSNKDINIQVYNRHCY